MKNSDIIYSLCVEDVQNVAEEVLNRSLTDGEINSIIDLIADNISWYDSIEMAIREKIKD